MNSVRISNRPAKLDTAKLKTNCTKSPRSEKANNESTTPGNKAYWKAIAEETERAAACGDTRKLYQMLKSVSRRPAGVGEVLLERDGNVIPDQARRLSRWEEHFKELLNHAAPPKTAFSPPDTSAAENYPCEVDPPTLEEGCTATRQLCSYRAPGEDDIPEKVYKTCFHSLGPWLHRMITKIWLCEAVPNNWSEVISSSFKEGDKRTCSNYRGISLINVAAEVFGVILLKRFQSERDQRTRPNQSGFRPGS